VSINSLGSALSGLLGGSSSTTSSVPFSFSGVASGLDTAGIINSLMAIERAPLQQFNQQKAKIQARDQAYQDVKSKLQSVQTALTTLLQSSAINVKSANVSAPTGSSTIMTASATSDAVAGSYAVNVTQLATASSITTSKPMSKGVNPAATLASSGMLVTPTTGTFTVNGVSISINATTDTLNSIVNKITDSSMGGSGGATGVTASIVNDANGNPNFIKLTPISTTQAIQLGSGSDTSNFLSAANLVATNVAGGAVQSTAPLSQANPGNTLSTQPFNLATGTTLASSGSFIINGTTINWSNTDSLSTVLNRINTSQAGVRATYNAQADQVTLTNLATGNQAVNVSETAPPAGQSGLLAAFGLVGPNAVSTAGKTAQFTIASNGGPAGPTQYSNSNTITGALPGVTLNLTGTGTNTVTVAQDTTTAANNIQSFISAFNTAVDTIDTYTKYDPTTKKGSVLTGDSTILGIASSLKSMLGSAALVPTGSAYKTLGDIGITTGAYGSALGSTNHLTLNSSKLTTALLNNSSAVFSVLSGLVGTATLTDARGNALASGNSWLQSVSGQPSNQTASGRYQITYNPAVTTNNVTSIFTASSGGTSAAVLGTVTAGSTTGVVPGMLLTAKGAPVAGTEYVTYNVTTSGVFQGVGNYLTSLLQTGGVFDTESQIATKQTTDINNQITSLNTRLTQRQQTLQAQFTQMEVAMSKLQQQSASLTQKLSGN
jgi:flagellar hook-associated protein 2